MGARLYAAAGFRAVERDALAEEQTEAVVGGAGEDMIGFGKIMQRALPAAKPPRTRGRRRPSPPWRHVR